MRMWYDFLPRSYPKQVSMSHVPTLTVEVQMKLSAQPLYIVPQLRYTIATKDPSNWCRWQSFGSRFSTLCLFDCWPVASVRNPSLPILPALDASLDPDDGYQSLHNWQDVITWIFKLSNSKCHTTCAPEMFSCIGILTLSFDGGCRDRYCKESTCVIGGRHDKSTTLTRVVQGAVRPSLLCFHHLCFSSQWYYPWCLAMLQRQLRDKA